LAYDAVGFYRARQLELAHPVDWEELRRLRAAFPELHAGELQALHDTVQTRRQEQADRLARERFDDLVSAEQRTGDLPALILEAGRFLHEFPDSPHAAEVRRRRDLYGLRLEEKHIQPARDYSAREPLDFRGRCEHYRHYLHRHPGGAFTGEAELALKRITAEWDKYDFRAVRDRFAANPGDTQTLTSGCQAYLALHPEGHFKGAAAALLRWVERVTRPSEYRVVLRRGEFDKHVARFFSRGPKLSVDLEVAGVRYGPSSIVYNRYDPEWNYEFPRPVRWHQGDPVHIRVTEHSWMDRVVFDLASRDGEPLALLLLAGEVSAGPNRLTFESDFALPDIPAIE
jgi:hypothetical protein